jgi:hypothetical protein
MEQAIRRANIERLHEALSDLEPKMRCRKLPAESLLILEPLLNAHVDRRQLKAEGNGSRNIVDGCKFFKLRMK